MADVFLAVDQGPTGSSKLIVLKRLRAQIADDPEFMEMLVDEARLVARLKHPNVVQTNEVGNVGKNYYIAMEFLDGQPLDRIQRRAREAKSIPLIIRATILSEVLAGLQHAHELADFDGTPLNVVHRDVTPHNIFVTYDGHVKVVDFGIAKAVGRAAAETRQGVIKGKVAYMSPEQAMGATLDARADLFAVGVMLWEAATGRRMWKDVDDMKILVRLIGGDVPISPRAVVPEVPEAVDRVCQRALAIKSQDRYPTAAAMQADLDAFIVSAGGRPSPGDIGKVVSELFKDRREELQRTIESKLRELKTLPPHEFVPATMDASGSISDLESPPRLRVKADTSGEEATKLTVTGVTRSATGARTQPSEVRSPGKSGPRLVGAAIIAVGILATTAIVIRRQTQPEEGPAGSAASVAPVQAAAAPDATPLPLAALADAGAAIAVLDAAPAQTAPRASATKR